MEKVDASRIDYQGMLAHSRDHSDKSTAEFLVEELPPVWCEAYRRMSPRDTYILRVQHNTFNFIYDAYRVLEVTGAVPVDPIKESRLVAVLGISEPSKKARDDYRLKGWVGPTEKTYGRRWDKGHFIANSIGGAVDRLEVNVFVQRRDLNRGWSVEGKRYREMEKYCVLHPGTFCFSRPLYVDETSRPAFLEFGILKPEGELWIECFDNR
jgi:hypothetical protein